MTTQARYDNPTLRSFRDKIAEIRADRAAALENVKLECARGLESAKKRAARLRRWAAMTVEKAEHECAEHRREIRASSLSAIAKQRALLAHERDVRALEAARQGKRRGRTAIEALQESDDAVEVEIDPSLIPLWRKTKRKIKGTKKLSRAEAFLQYAHEHPDEAIVAIEESVPSDDEFSRMQAEYYEKERRGNPARWPTHEEAMQARLTPDAAPYRRVGMMSKQEYDDHMALLRTYAQREREYESQGRYTTDVPDTESERGYQAWAVLTRAGIVKDDRVTPYGRIYLMQREEPRHGNPAGLSFVSSRDNGHTHRVTIHRNDLDVERARSYETTRDHGHTHVVMLSPCDLHAIARGEEVETATSTDAGHFHTFSFKRVLNPAPESVVLHPTKEGWEGRSRGRDLSEFDQDELARGTEVEMEHTSSRAVAARTAADHLTEDPHYYSKLERHENPTSSFSDDDRDRIARYEDPDDVETRARAAGAKGQLEYVGMGATGIVVCDAKERAFKIGRKRREKDVSPSVYRSLEDEGEWLKVAQKISEVKPHVAHLFSWDPENVVLVKACVRGQPGGRGLWDIYKNIEKHMRAHGWSAPEFKDDSWITPEGGTPVLVDAGQVLRLGDTFVKYVKETLAGKRKHHEEKIDLAYQVRSEAVDNRISDKDARALLERLVPAGHDLLSPIQRRQNPARHSSETFVRGDEVSFIEVGDGDPDDREIVLHGRVRRFGKGKQDYTTSNVLVHDPGGKAFRSCDVLIVKQGRGAGNCTEGDDGGKAGDYYPNAALECDVPFDTPRGKWRKIADVEVIRYRRWWDEYQNGQYKFVPFEHPFETPVALYQCDNAYKLRLPNGCVLDERGFVVP